MTSLIFISLAAILNSVMDTIKDHYAISIFQNMNPQFWNPAVSWMGKKFLGIEVLDAWHIAKGLMLTCFMLAVYFSEKTFIQLFLVFVVWQIGFELFYSILLIKKTKCDGNTV